MDSRRDSNIPGTAPAAIPKTPRQQLRASTSAPTILIHEPEEPANEDGSDEQARPLLDSSREPSTSTIEYHSGEGIKKLFPFARIDILKNYIPELDPADPRAQTLRVRMSKRYNMLRLQFILTSLIVVANLVFTIWACVAHPPDGRGVGVIRLGDCEEIRRINSILHLLINALSSLFLGAGNYCMQILVAPSRSEMDYAHSKGESLDIGVPSLKNLRYIKWQRTIIWFLLGMLSTVLHLIWNSMIFSSFPVVSYPRALVTSDYKTANANWDTAPLPAPYTLENYNPHGGWDPILGMQANLPNFTYLDRASCVKRYINPLIGEKAPLVIVSLNVTSSANEGYSLLHGAASDWNDGDWTRSSWWICDSYGPDDMRNWKPCTGSLVKRLGLYDEWVLPASDRMQEGIEIEVDYCLAGAVPDTDAKCGLHYGLHMLVAVTVCTFFDSLLILLVFRRSGRKHGTQIITELPARTRSHSNEWAKTMVLMGDAIAEYLQSPGPMPRQFEMRKRTWDNRSRQRWFMAASRTTWAVSISLFAIGIGVPLYLLVSSISGLRGWGIDITMRGIWQRGLQTADPSTLAFDSGTVKYSLPACVLLSNMFQIWLSFLYIFYNNILTRQLVADEWTRFLQPSGKKPLRVSQPEGMQRSSYMLSLPFTYSVPLMLSMMVLHWLVSQSVFLEQTMGFDTSPDPARVPSFDRTAVGYSQLGQFLAIGFGGLLLIALLTNSALRQYVGAPPGFVRAGMSSALIRAFCQRPEEDSDASYFPVRLGAIEDRFRKNSQSGPQVLAFSTYTDIAVPVSMEDYLLPVYKSKASSSFRALDFRKLF